MKDLQSDLSDTIYNLIKNDKKYNKKKKYKKKRIILDGNAGGYAPGRIRDLNI